MIKSYPKILPLVGKYGDLVLGNTVEVTEKCDGSMFAFGLSPDGVLHMRSKGQPIDINAVPDLFRPAADHVLSVQDKLEKGVVYYGETLKTPRHNTLSYDRVPTNHIALFGKFDWERTKGADYAEVAEAAALLDVDVVPLLGNVAYDELAQFAELLKASGKSWLGGADMEGIVIKDYTRPMEFSGMVYPLTVLKYVSEAFKEKHSNNPDWIGNKDKVALLVDSYRTEARWHKAVQHLRDNGELLGEPKDIGILIKELSRDLVEECKEDFKDSLYNLFQKEWKARVTARFPEWYKEELLK